MTENLPKIINHLPALTNQIKRIAIEAGELIYDYFDESGFSEVQLKADGSPVTKADKAGEEYIIEKLKKSTPTIPIIGEELISAGHKVDLSNSEYYWLVDALDGTKGFIAGDGDFTVNIALIKNENPIVGVIYAPHYGELYYGYGKDTAKRWLEDTNKEKSLRTRKMPSKGLTVMSSKYRNSEKRDKYLQQYKVNKIIRRYSSIKICMVAAGKADIYPCFGQTCYWDTAAGDAILRSAGGCIIDLQGNPLKYNPNTKQFLNPQFLAISNDFLL